MMNGYSAEMIVMVLNREFPDIAGQINQRIKERLPESILVNTDYIKDIINQFVAITGFSGQWVNDLGHNTVTYNRCLMIAVVLMFYDPQKLMKLSSDNTKRNVLKQISLRTGCDNRLLYMSTSNSIVMFRAYSDFREEVYRIYNAIKDDNKFFELKQ